MARGSWALDQPGTAVAAAATHRPRPGSVAGHHRPGTDRARGRMVCVEALPDTDDQVVERRPLARWVAHDAGVRGDVEVEVQRERRHATALKTPTTRPRIWTSL